MTGATGLEQPLLIDGAWVQASHGRTYVKTDPFTGEAATDAAAASVADAQRAAEAAHDAFAAWAATPAEGRARLLRSAADLLDKRAPDIAATMTAECGATFGWGMFNCALAAEVFRHAATLAHEVDKEVPIESHVPGLRARAIRRPAGVVTGIAPWNAPLILAARAVAAPLALGNTVVLKASEECPRTHAAIASAIHDAGVPNGVINLITNQPEDAPGVVEALIAHPAVARVNFTGSTRVGTLIARAAATYLKRTLLELGGKAPFVVLADADLDEAAAAANFGAFMNSGQICMSTERVVVDRAVASAFEAKLVARAEALTVGDPRDPDTQIGPVINEAAARRIRELVADARAKGARVLTGGDAKGLLVEPTVVADVTPEMRLYGEESFGPVVTVIAVDGPNEAVRVANDTEYGLSAAVFGRDVAAAEKVARRIESGICHINGATVHDEPTMPFGGVKHSGWGRFGSGAVVEEFTDLRWLTVQDGSRPYPI
ncbi:aldehyde dehydrogenase family protein [Streptomyces sp. NBC_00582]|uniref:aldehyde dehydrogenase family protein n=1 Tax=Streptomyces sp. NBC_00582 TaxID=2975783 RepID=UPI002E807EB6|nr:aldehyde dehydrogenase family protein [Streptomyces sp. NBC_00582]WUB66047.1 aldehyde dehydrogenase family protein [Streptomyces sp. NBC_00582]